MGVYRLRDALLVPGLISLARLPLAAVFALVTDPVADLAILLLAGLTDVLDGWWARRYDQATPTGAVIDPITDKVFVLTVVVTMVMREQLSVVSVLLLSTRELGELPLVVWLGLNRKARATKADHPKANWLGKAATTLQFVTIAAALFQFEQLDWLIYATAIGGIIAALGYWRREITTYRKGA